MVNSTPFATRSNCGREFIDKPNNAYAKAQNICQDRLDSVARE